MTKIRLNPSSYLIVHLQSADPSFFSPRKITLVMYFYIMNHSLLCVLLNHESRCLGGGGVCKGCECFGEQGGLGLGGGGGE